MSYLNMKCRNCGGAMEIIDNQLACPYCKTTILHIVDAKIDADVSLISPEEFAQKIEESKRQFVININQNLEVFDIKTRVINKKISDASELLAKGEFDQIGNALSGVPSTILSAERIRYLAYYRVKNETELLEHNGPVEDACYQNILELADPETKATYVKLAEFCRQKYAAREEAISKVREGEQLLLVDLKEDALIYAQKMCQEYPMYAISWLFLAHVARSLDPHYNCAREWGIIHYCFDYKYYNDQFPYGLTEVFKKRFGHDVKVSKSLKSLYKKWVKVLGSGCSLTAQLGVFGIFFTLGWAAYWAAITLVLAPITAFLYFLFYLPRFLRGKQAVEQGFSHRSHKVPSAKALKNKRRRRERITTIALLIIGIAVVLGGIFLVTMNYEWHDGMRYKQKSGMLYLVDGGSDTQANVVIPAEIRGMTVVSIEREAFFEHQNMKSVEIPSSVTSIGEDAFRSCKNLTTITIPSNVTHIDARAFSGTAIKSVKIPLNLTKIGESAFPDLDEIVFEQPEGWKAEKYVIDSEKLKNPREAAKLRNLYGSYSWYRR